ncbi:MAG: prepilin-type N-terminal cleavage/methylation domain-containing protein [Candidatus Peribacteria bacterium]|nr:prepilin-type N-terminal cleavage/methylation domain-containing protein [Candidatus Peribacteria bacterium]
MKFFNKKSLTFSSVLTGKDESTLKAKAFTLAELITSMVIISILVLIVFVFTTANIENLASNTVQVATVE